MNMAAGFMVPRMSKTKIFIFTFRCFTFFEFETKILFFLAYGSLVHKGAIKLHFIMGLGANFWFFCFEN